MLGMCRFVINVCMNKCAVHTLVVTLDAVMIQFQTYERELCGSTDMRTDQLSMPDV